LTEAGAKQALPRAPQVADGFRVIVAAENRSAGVEDVGAVFNRYPCRHRINAAVHFDIQHRIVFCLPIACTTHFFHLFAAEGLATKTRMYRHDEKKIELAEKWLQQGKWRGRIYGQTSTTAPAAN